MIAAPAPLWLATDPRATSLSAAARGLLLEVVLAYGSVELLADSEPEPTLAELIRRGDRDAARDAAREVVASGVVRLHHLADGRRCLALAVPARPETPVVEPATPTPTASAEPVCETTVAALVAARRRPSESPAAVRLRKDRSLYGGRRAPFRTVAPGLSWAEWCDTPAGARHVRDREATHPGYEALAARVEVTTPGHEVTTPGHDQGHDQGHEGVTTPLARASSAGVSLVKTSKGGGTQTRADDRGGSGPASDDRGQSTSGARW